MHDDLPDVPALRAHEPPPGGLAALRERLDAAPRRRWWWLAAPALALAAAIAFLVLRHPATTHTITTAPLPDREIVKTTDVTFYWVASSPTSPQRTAAPAIPTVAPAVSIADAPRVNFGPQ